MRKKILFIGLNDSSFCINDELILKNEYDVDSIYISMKEFKKILFLPILIIKKIRKSDAVYIWFGDFHAVIGVIAAKIFFKKSIIVAGGYDVAYEPSIDYGLLTRPIGRYFPKIAFSLCDKIIAVSNFTRNETLRIVKDENKIVTISNAIDLSAFNIRSLNRNAITTVGNVTPLTMRVKGIEHFIGLAEKASKSEFILVGRIDQRVKIGDLSNLRRTGYLNGNKLAEVLNESKYYLQLSFRESFGVAVIEAMACGCIPIVTKRGGLPEVVGDIGYQIEYGDFERVVEIINRDYDIEEGKRARERVVERFDLELRKKKILELVDVMINRKEC